MYSGFMIADLIATVERVQKRLAAGPNNDGRMTPEDVQAWFDLEAFKGAIHESQDLSGPDARRSLTDRLLQSGDASCR
jgi:hypothetical protein